MHYSGRVKMFYELIKRRYKCTDILCLYNYLLNHSVNSHLITTFSIRFVSTKNKIQIVLSIALQIETYCKLFISF